MSSQPSLISHRRLTQHVRRSSGFNVYTNSGSKIRELVVRAKDKGRMCWYKVSKEWYSIAGKIEGKTQASLNTLKGIPKKARDLPANLGAAIRQLKRAWQLDRRQRRYRRHAFKYRALKVLRSPFVSIRKAYTRCRKRMMNETTSKYGRGTYARRRRRQAAGF